MNPNLAIRTIMTTEMITVNPEASLKRVKEIFSSNPFHHIPVVGSNGALIGIISREDFYKVSYLFSSQVLDSIAGSLNNLCSQDIMTKYPIHLEPDDSIGLAADIFLANKFHALPIVEDGKLTGIVTSHDLLAFSFNSPIEYNADIGDYNEDS